jgi:hypothetical protein
MKITESEYNNDQHNEEELNGYLSVTICNGTTFNEFCKSNFDNYNPELFDAIALRVLYGKEIVITLYALDKLRQAGTNYGLNKLPVKKFKKTVFSFADILPFIKEFNFTLTTGNYTLEDMDIVNK